MTQCEGFAWIGQPITTCDNCGQPGWDHDFDLRASSPFGSGGFHQVPWSERLIGAWLSNGFITRERAAELLMATPEVADD